MLFVVALVGLLLLAALLIWGAFALAGFLRRRARADSALSELEAPGARLVGGPAFTHLPNEEVPSRIPFGQAAAPAPDAPAGPPAPDAPAGPHAGPPAEIIATDVPLAAVRYTPAMLEPAPDIPPGTVAGTPPPIEMPEELSVRVEAAAALPRNARPLIDSVPDFNAPDFNAPDYSTSQPAHTPQREAEQARTAHSDTASSDLAYDHMDATIITGRRNRAWVFETESGQRVPLSAEVVLLGRNPSHRPGHEDAQLVTVRDAWRTVSKTHVLLRRHDDSWRITDLDSTNGVYLLGPSGEEIELEPGVPAGITDRFILGEMSARIFQEE